MFVVVSAAEVVDGVINSILDDMFPAETAASDVINTLLDRVMTGIKRRGLCTCVFLGTFVSPCLCARNLVGK